MGMTMSRWPTLNEAAVRRRLAAARRWVVKVGSAQITDGGRGLARSRIDAWAADIAALVADRREVVIVSSGAVAEGCARLGIARPEALHGLQAAAAVGQTGLVGAYEAAFQRYGVHAALVLLTHDDLSNRRRYLNARTTLRALLDAGVVPVINENDTVAFDELRFGDNDTLAALVANLVEADGLQLLTDQPGLMTADPRLDSDAELVPFAAAGDERLDAMARTGSGTLGRGGMFTKLRAARLAARSGTHTVIADGSRTHVVERIAHGEQLGTLLMAAQDPLAARKRWIAGQLQTRGELILDEGAVRALRSGRRSLLPVGVTGARGHFERGEVVICRDPGGQEVARGLVNYSVAETRRIMGRSSAEIAGVLGYAGDEELVHRDNLVLAER